LGKLHVVGDRDDPALLFIFPAQEAHDHIPVLGVQVACQFVRQDQAWAYDQCSSDCYPLFLTARKGVHSLGQERLQVQQFHQFVIILNLVPPVIQVRQQDIPLAGQSRDQIIGLKKIDNFQPQPGVIYIIPNTLGVEATISPPS